MTTPAGFFLGARSIRLLGIKGGFLKFNDQTELVHISAQSQFGLNSVQAVFGSDGSWDDRLAENAAASPLLIYRLEAMGNMGVWLCLSKDDSV